MATVGVKGLISFGHNTLFRRLKYSAVFLSFIVLEQFTVVAKSLESLSFSATNLCHK